MQEIVIVLIPIIEGSRETANNLENKVFSDRLALTKELSVNSHTYELTDFMELCNDEEFNSNLFWVSYVTISTINTVWGFVEKYYPNYSSSNEILYADDLQKIADLEDEEGSAARGILTEEFDGNRDEALNALHAANETIFSAAITGFINQINQ